MKNIRRFPVAIAASVLGMSLLLSVPVDAKPPVSPDATNPDVSAPNAAAHEMLGSYVGAFGSNKITVCLEKVVGQSVSGYSVVAGNERAFSGSLTEKDGAFEILAKEPGDDPEDGIFVFHYQPGPSSHLTGTWTPNNAKKLAKKEFDLGRREYRYDAKIGLYPQSSTRLLKAKDVENIRPEDLRIMRNEIYARHGYSFRMRDMRSYFDSQDWYMPISTDVTSKLTTIEQKNQELIKRYEKYGADHYDSFGR